ncbi:MAG: FAD-linked oxidase C-terminal domain-containing protein [Bacteroidota bacterium]|nr:FAD-linked oxidase C-terminal domain-containing protein [Bacteroidota bacterium]
MMEFNYNKIKHSDIEKIKEIVGSENIFTEEETRNIYGSDETEDFKFPPEVVVKPIDTQQVSKILKLANEINIPVTPRGGGTGLSGGALPIYGGICLSMEKFNRIIEIDEKNFQAVVEPGVITQKFQEELESRGLFYPPDPASRGSCMLGGNLAENSGGPHAVKYGVTKDYVLSIEAVLPTGEIISTGSRTLKNVSGYNLTQLIIGSEGTLAVITKIIVRLIPLPKLRKVMLVAFNSIEDSVSAVASIFQEGITPAAIEFMEKSAIKATEEKNDKKFPNSNAEAHLLIEVDGNYEEILNKEIETIARVVERHNSLDILLAEDRQKVNDVWDLRRSIGEAVKSISAYKEEDTVVPRAHLPQLVKGVKDICNRYGITSICYGHAGDGNVHVNILKDKLDDKTWDANIDKAIREIFQLTVSLGGTISGEHGIGYSQKSYLPIALSEIEIELMKKIKHLFDPKNILNPGKIFA